MKNLTQAGLVLLLIVAVGAEVWLNRTAWGHRRLMWQLQAAVVAGGVLLLVGLLLARARIRSKKTRLGEFVQMLNSMR